MADIKPNTIYTGECNFCKAKEVDVMFINFQAVCEDCAGNTFLPILIKFGIIEVTNAA